MAAMVKKSLLTHPVALRALSKILLLLLVGRLCFHYDIIVSNRNTELFLSNIGVNQPHSLQPKFTSRGSRSGPFTKGKILYYPNSMAAYSLRRIILSGDVELNPGMSVSRNNNSGTQKNRKRRCINIAHLNVRSLKKREHYILLRDLAKRQKLDILTISESWLNATVSDLEIEFPGFTLFRLDRINKPGGGVCAFVRNEFKCVRLSEISYIAESGLHQLWLKVQVRNFKSFVVCTAYRTEDVPLSCFDTDLSLSLTSAMSLNIPVFILGDFNCDVLKPDQSDAKALLDFCHCFNLSQIIDRPTRITQSTRTLIDVILTSKKDLVTEVKVTPHSISDHELIIASLNLKRNRPKPTYMSTRSFKHYDKDAFLQDISNAPWSVIDILDDVEDKIYAFNQLFNQILDKHAPIKTVKVRTRPLPFIDDNIRALMRTRDHWQKLARSTNDAAAWAGYRNFKREVKYELRLAQRVFVEEQIIRNAGNTNSMWKTIRSCIPKTANTRSYIEDDKTVANKFNKFFISIRETTENKIQSLASKFNYQSPQPPFVPREHPISEQFVFEMVKCSDVEEVIKYLPNNKAPGIDKIPSRVIKDSFPVVVPLITSIINSSFVSGVFPSVWKIAEVCPILKDGDHEDASNNRPISLLPILSKICEKVALNQLSCYLSTNQRLAPNQSGNKKWHSTETSLLSSTDVILKAMDKKKVTAVVYLDLSKAFDSINHSILLNKLRDVGMSPTVLSWFESYLSQRSQVVRINSTLSEPLSIVSGVPQGSVLGALLFSIYVNDLPSVSQNCQSECYVDDTKLLLCFSANDSAIAKDNINADLLKIRNWCFDNRLLINPDKTKLMIFGTHQMIHKLPDFNLSLLGKELSPAESVKDLGVIFDPTLTFNNHILSIVSSCMSKLAQINRVKHAFNSKLLVNIINALVFSKLLYCSSVWSNTTVNNIRKLQSVQNFAARIVSGVRKYDHITPTLKSLGWLPISKHLYYRDAVLAFKCMTGCAPSYLTSQFVTRGQISGRNTRNSQLLNIPLYKSASGQRTFQYRVVSIWNDIHKNLKLCKDIIEFKKALKKKLRSEFVRQA